MAEPQVYVLGSANVDRYLLLEHIVRAGETILAQDTSASLGGKGLNQAVASARYGARTHLVGCLGTDVEAELIFETITSEPRLDTSLMTQVESHPTGIATIQRDRKGENSIIVAAGANAALHPDHAVASLNQVSTDDLVLAQLEIPYPTVVAGLRAGQRAGARTVLNAAPATTHAEVLEYTDVLVVNEIEATTLSGDTSGLGTVDLATRLSQRYHLDVVVTLGERGCQVSTQQGQELVTVPARDTDVVDTTGAGDAFTGALVAALVAGEDVVTAAAWGTVAGSFACESQGAQGYPTRQPDLEEKVPAILDAIG
ncbi:ribokinase [Auritidibacter ignavus]|uniref:ribokinase n=1 Tax=Auritidibacter ignavus TaxID=678932 RepID=UPI00109C32B0|nr:ribokinase [Auritidibacter ignavus]